MSAPKKRKQRITSKIPCSATKERYRRVVSAIHMVYRLVNSTYNVKELLLRLTRLVCQVVSADSASVYLLDSSHKKIMFIASYNGRINFLFDKKKDLAQIPQERKDVALGNTFIQKRLIGIPLVADDNVGAIFIERNRNSSPFGPFDKELFTLMAEQVVTAIRNLQLYEEQQKIIMGSIRSIGRLLESHFHAATRHAPAYLKVIRALAEELRMRRDEMASLQYASILHDAGIVDVPYEILSKSSRLTPEELKVIRKHPSKTVELLKAVDFLKPVLPIILYHHEKYDGTGYPSGLKKEQIPLGARLMSIVDAFEAMVQGRPYRKALSITEALKELQKSSGSQFDPKIIDTFLRLAKRKKFRKYLSLLKE